MGKPSITEQREAVEALINEAVGHGVLVGLEPAKQAVVTLSFIERNAGLARVLAAVMNEFPGADVVEDRGAT